MQVSLVFIGFYVGGEGGGIYFKRYGNLFRTRLLELGFYSSQASINDLTIFPMVYKVWDCYAFNNIVYFLKISLLWI